MILRQIRPDVSHSLANAKMGLQPSAATPFLPAPFGDRAGEIPDRLSEIPLPEIKIMTD